MKCALTGFLVLGMAVAGCVDLASLLGGGGGGAGARNDLAAPGGNYDEAGAAPPGQPLPTSGVISARVRNFTGLSADVTMRFLLNDVVVHLSFLRVPAHTSTTVVGPDVADRVEAGGVNENSEPLPGAVFEYGLDFSEGTEAVYIIGDELSPENVPPTIVFVQPVADVQVPQGGQVQVVIADEDPDSSATIDFYLDPNDQALDGNEIVLATGIAEDPDGPDDAFSFAVANDLPVGIYRLVAVIADELSTDIVQAPGLIEVVPPGGVDGGQGDGDEDDQDEEEPDALVTLELLEPAIDLEVRPEGSFTVVWAGQASDENAIVSVYLDPGGAVLDGDELLIASGLPLAPDSGRGRVELFVPDVEPGAYGVLGVLTSADGSASAVAAGRLIVLPAGEGPGLVILEPAFNVPVHLGETVYLAWSDVDDDNNATITFYLDQNAVDLDGGEVWVGAFKEDPDGPGADDADVPIVNVQPGTYQLLGIIFDGVLWQTARARGLVIVVGPTEGGTTGPGLVDCQPNGVPDGQELEGNDCNSNGVPDECDVAAGTSGDVNTDGIPDECQAGLGGYWRFDFYADLNCDYFEQFTHEVRYLYFAADNRITESWILTDGWAVGQNQAYLRINYPSTDGPSYTQYRQGHLTENTSRTIACAWPSVGDEPVRITESVSLPGGDQDGEAGTTIITGMPSVTADVLGGVTWVGLEGTWQFQAGDTLVCGRLAAEEVAEPPVLPAVVDLEPVTLTLSATDLTTPGTVQVTDRAYRVRYSFVTEPVTVRYFLSPDPWLDRDGDLLLGSEPIARGPGGTLGLHAGPGPSLDIPGGLSPSCEAFILAVIDADGVLDETSEDNNVLALPVTVSAGGRLDCAQ